MERFNYIKARKIIRAKKSEDTDLLAELSTFAEILKDKGISENSMHLAVDLAFCNNAQESLSKVLDRAIQERDRVFNLKDLLKGEDK